MVDGGLGPPPSLQQGVQLLQGPWRSLERVQWRRRATRGPPETAMWSQGWKGLPLGSHKISHLL